MVGGKELPLHEFDAGASNDLDPLQERVPDAFGPDGSLRILLSVSMLGLERHETGGRLLEQPAVEVLTSRHQLAHLSLERLRRTLQNLDRRHERPPWKTLMVGGAHLFGFRPKRSLAPTRMGWYSLPRALADLDGDSRSFGGGVLLYETL